VPKLYDFAGGVFLARIQQAIDVMVRGL